MTVFCCAFEGGEFGATVYASLDVAARGETIEFDTNIGIEVLVHGLIAVVGPDLLLECWTEDGRYCQRNRAQTNQLETIAIIQASDDMTSDGCE